MGALFIELTLWLLYCEIFACSPARPPIVKMLVLVIFYCENLMQQAMIMNYWLKVFTLRNMAKMHVILEFFINLKVLGSSQPYQLIMNHPN